MNSNYSAFASPVLKVKLFQIGFFLLVSLLASTSVFGQAEREIKRLTKKAQKHESNMEFSQAAEVYAQILELDSENFQANYELALLYYQVNFNPERAYPYFLKSEALMGKDTVFDVYFYLGAISQYLENYDVAIKYYNLTKKGLIDNVSGRELRNTLNRFTAQCEFAKVYDFNAFNGAVRNMENVLNTAFSDYSSLYMHRDSLILFTSRSDNANKGFFEDFQKFESIVYSNLENGKWKGVKVIDENKKFLNLKSTKGHDAVVDVSKTGDTLVIYKEGLLWYSTVQQDGTISVPVKFPKNINISNYQTHGSFSPDGKTFYFASNLKGGFGGLDLYKVVSDGNGGWGTPENLGPSINTEFDEDSPFISVDGKRLFFSSKGHLGFGGYDIFFSDLEDGIFSAPVNAGKPLNSPGDDMYFKTGGPENNLMYFSSHRKGGFGSMDLYTYKRFRTPEFKNCTDFAFYKGDTKIIAEGPEEAFVNKAINLDASSSVVENAVIIDYFWRVNKDTILEGPYFSYTNKEVGEFFLELEIIARDDADNESRFCISRKVPVLDLSESDKVKARELALKAGQKGDVKTSSTKTTGRENPQQTYTELANEIISTIYFGFDKDNLSDTEKEKLKESINKITQFPDGSITLVGHTDNLGSDAYNQELSLRRANEVNNYLIKNGIRQSTIAKIEGKGAKQPVGPNSNPDGSDNQEGRAKNRRVEVIVAPSVSLAQGGPASAVAFDPIYFAFDKHNLSSESIDLLNKHAETLKANPEISLEIVGFTDILGSLEYNMVLSERRAKRAFDYLVQKGISPERLSISYKGPELKDANVEDKVSPEVRKLNRRVDFLMK
ncbi:MAG: OmpA family protein [Luteibaculaceae bacterium]